MNSNTKHPLIWLVLLSGWMNACDIMWAQDASPATTETATWQQAVRAQGQALVGAYEAGDAQQLSELFWPDGEYIDSAGVVYRGRDAIQEEFAAYFAAAPTRQMEVEIDEIRKVGTSTVFEDGRVTVRRGESNPAYFSRYMTIYVQENGAWKIASLRDLSSEFASPGDRLQSLQWLVGDWIEESDDGVVEMSFYWSEDGNFLVGDYNYQVDGVVQVSGSYRIGWDGHSKQIFHRPGIARGRNVYLAREAGRQRTGTERLVQYRRRQTDAGAGGCRSTRGHGHPRQRSGDLPIPYHGCATRR